MAQLRQGSFKTSSESNVFTVLLVITAVVIAIGLGYTWYKHQTLFGTHPFSVETSSHDAWSEPARDGMLPLVDETAIRGDGAVTA